MELEKEDISEINNVEMFEETIANLKQNKARAKMLIQENITVDHRVKSVKLLSSSPDH